MPFATEGDIYQNLGIKQFSSEELAQQTKILNKHIDDKKFNQALKGQRQEEIKIEIGYLKSQINSIEQVILKNIENIQYFEEKINIVNDEEKNRYEHYIFNLEKENIENKKDIENIKQEINKLKYE